MEPSLWHVSQSRATVVMLEHFRAKRKAIARLEYAPVGP